MIRTGYTGNLTTIDKHPITVNIITVLVDFLAQYLQSGMREVFPF